MGGLPKYVLGVIGCNNLFHFDASCGRARFLCFCFFPGSTTTITATSLMWSPSSAVLFLLFFSSASPFPSLLLLCVVKRPSLLSFLHRRLPARRQTKSAGKKNSTRGQRGFVSQYTGGETDSSGSS